MVGQFVDTLLELDSAPAVTVTMSLDHGRRDRSFRLRLRGRVDEARRMIAAGADPALAGELLDRLDEAVDQIELTPGARGVVLVATPTFSAAKTVRFPVRDDVALGPTPATRYLVQGMRRSPRYRALVVSDRGMRLFDCVRDTAVEVHDHGFPMAERVPARDRRVTGGRFARPTGRDVEEPRRQFYRAVDRALTEATRDDPLPLVLLGVRRSTRLFLATSTNANHIVGYVDGSHDGLPSHAIGTRAWPVMQRKLRRRRAAVAGELVAAIGTGAAVTGLDEVWQLAREGRGRLLVVEEDFRGEPAVEVDGHLRPAIDAADAMDDPVDEVIEHVLRARGSVEFLASGALADFDRIGLFLR